MGTNVVYEWGKRSYAVEAQVVGSIVERITEREGMCAPGQLVDEASDPGSPLHPLFTWDNDEAAAKWRTHEARKVINSLVVSVKVEDREITAPAFISVGHHDATREAGEGYRPVQVVVADPAFANEALSEAMSRLRSLRQRYAAIEALAPVWQAIDQVA